MRLLIVGTIFATWTLCGLLLVGLGFALRLVERREGHARGEYSSGEVLHWGCFLCVPALYSAAYSAALPREGVILVWIVVLFSYLLLGTGAVLLLCELQARKIGRLGSVRVLLWGGILFLLTVWDYPNLKL
jgi:hypothetical protein